MQIEKVQCLVRVTQNGQTNLTQIVLAGPDAIPVTEIPILRMINDINEGGEDDCCVTGVVGKGFIDTSKGNEIARLKQKYGQIVDACYPGGRALPIALIDCELPDHALDKAAVKAARAAAAEEAKRLEEEAAEKEAADAKAIADAKAAEEAKSKVKA